MATVADISDLISPMKIEVEDKELNTGNSRIAPEELIDVGEKVKSTLVPLFETTKVENSNDIADVDVINEGIVKEGENFLNSPSFFHEELEKNSKKDQLNSIERVNGSQTGEEIDIKTNENNTGLVTEPTDFSQGTALNIERVRDVTPLMEKRDDTLTTEATLSQQVSTETNFIGEDDSRNKYLESLLTEKAKEEIKKIEISKHEPDHVVKEIVEENLEDKTDTLAETCELDEPLELDRSFTHKNESAIKNVEMLVTEASDEIEITPSSETRDQIPVKEEDETTISAEAILLENPEEKNLASDLDEKNGATSYDVNATSLLVEKEVQITSEKQNYAPIVETEHFDKKDNEQIMKEEELDQHEITSKIEKGEEEVKNEPPTHLVTECQCEDNETLGKIGDEEEPNEPSKILDIKKVRYDGPIEEKGDDTLTTEATLSQLDSTETSFKGEDDSLNKNSESHLTENVDDEVEKVEMSKQEPDYLAMKCEHEVAMIVTKDVEKPVTEASEEMEITPSKTRDQISAKEDETTISGEINVLATPEKENLTAEVVDTDKSGINSNATSLVEEDVQIMSEKSNQDSTSEGPEDEQESKSSVELIQTANYFDKNAYDQIIKEEEFKEAEITKKRENIEEVVKSETLTEHATDSNSKEMTSLDQGNETAEKVGGQEEPEEPSTLEATKNKSVDYTEESEDVSSLISQAPIEEIKESVEKADTEVKQINVPLGTENEVLEREINLDRESESNVKNVRDIYETTTSLCVEESGVSEIQNGEHGEIETKTQIEEGKGLEGFDAVPESENQNFEEIHETKTSTNEINSEEISEINEAENLGSKKNLDSHSIEEVKAIDQYPVSGQTPAKEEREELKLVAETENRDAKIEDEITQQNETTVTKADVNRVREETNSELIPEPHVKSVEDVDEIDSPKENIEISKQASEEIEISPTSELPDQIPAKEDETTISGDIIVLATPEEKNLIATDLDEKNGEAEVAVTDNTGDESIFSSTLLEENTQIIDEKLDQDSKLETEIQVLEESEDPEGAQFVKKEEFEEPEITEKSANIEKDVNKETPAEHATGCNNEDTTRCTQEDTVAKIGDGKEPEESPTLEEPENITENGTEKTDDVSSLVSQTEDTENCVEKAETNMKQISEPLEETSIMKPQLPEHDIEKEDLERAKNLDNESESNVKNVQDMYETTASSSVEESGAEEIENIIREVPKELSEENDESKTKTPIEHKTVEGSDAVPEFEDHTIEEICETKTSASEENYEEVLGNNENETLEAERKPDLHAIKEIEEIPIQEEKEEPNQFPELGNIVDKVENEITDKINTEVPKQEANEVTEKTNSENTEIQPEIQPVEENDEIEQKPHVKETEAAIENEETKNDDFITPTLANEEISSKEFQQNSEPGNVTDYVSSSENIDTHEKEDISQHNEGVEKIDLEDGTTAVSVNIHGDEERGSEIAKVDDEVEEVSAPLTMSEYKDQVIEDAIETDLSSTVHESDINEVSKVEKETLDKSPEVCGSNDQSFEKSREMETEPTSEITNYKMEEETKEAKISKSIKEPNVRDIEEISEIETTLRAGDIQAEEERAEVEERENEVSSKTDTEVMSLHDEVQELRTSEPVTQVCDEKKDELDPTPAVGQALKNEREETDSEMVKADNINKNGTQFNEDMADLIETGTAENVAQKELEILNPDATTEYTENKETEKQTNEEIIEATTKCNEVVTLFEDSETIEPIPTNATSSVITTPESIETVDTLEIEKNNLEETYTMEFQLQKHENVTKVSESFTEEKTDTENVEVAKSEVPAVTDQVYEADINDKVAHGRETQNESKVEHASKTITIENTEDGHMKNDDIEENNLNVREISKLQNIETVEKSDADVVKAEESTGFAELKAEISGGKGKEEEVKNMAENIAAPTTLDTEAVNDDEANENSHTLGKKEDHQESYSELLSEIEDENENFRNSKTKAEFNSPNFEETNDDEANEQPLVAGKSEVEYQETSSVLLFEKQDQNERSEVSETMREANIVGIEELHDKETTIANESFSTSVEDQPLATGEFKEKHQPSTALLYEKQDENEDIEICETKTESNVHGSDTTTDVEKTPAEKIEEETKEDLETIPEPKCQDISPITGSEVTSIREIEISDEAAKDFDIGSEIKIPETKETVDSKKFEETSIIESKLQEHGNEKEGFETVTVEKPDPNDVEVDKKIILNADSESLGVENQGPKAVSNDEIAPSWTSQAENIEEEIQNPCSVFPSSEKNHENATNTTKNTENELELLAEEVPRALPEGETQGPDVVLTDEISRSWTSQIENNEEEVPEASYVFVSSEESHETTGKNTEDDSNDEITPGSTSQAENNKEEIPESSSVFLSSEESQENVPTTTKSTEDECEKVIQEVPKALPEGKTQGPEAVSKDEIAPRWMSQAENFEEEVSNTFKEAVVSKSIPECEVLNVEEIQTETHTEREEDETKNVVETTCEPEHEDAAEIIARYIIFNQTFPEENKEELEMGVKETDSLPAAVTKEGSEREQVSLVVRESGEGGMGEINPIDEVIKASGGKLEEKSFDIVPESKDQSFEEASDTKKIMATEISNIDKVEENGSNLLEKIHGEAYNIHENESKKQEIEPCSAMLRDQDAVEDGMLKPEEMNKNIALSHENVFDLSEEGTTVENMLSKPVDEKCTETCDLEIEKIEKSLQPESEILGSVVNPTEKVTDIVDEILEEPTADIGESETHIGNTIEAAQAIKEITSKESLTEEPEKATTNNTLKEPTTETPEQVSTANAIYAEKENDENYVENEPITGNKGNEYDNLATETTMSTKEVESLEVTMEDPEEKLVDNNEEDETAVANTLNNIEESDVKEIVVIEEQEAKTNALGFPSKKATPDEELADKANVMVDKEQSNFILDPVSIAPKTDEQVEKLEPNETMKEPQEEKKMSLSLSQKQIAKTENVNEEKENQNAIASRNFQVKSEDSTAEKQVKYFEEGKHREEIQTPKNPAEVTDEPKTEAEEIALVEEEKTDEEREDDHNRTDSGSDAPVMVEASRDIDVKTPQKKSHNILSGVGSKVKHSIAKVKKAITGKSSHQKASSPKEDKKTELVPLL